MKPVQNVRVLPQRQAVSVSVSPLSVSDLLGALSRANEAAYVWSAGSDTLDWVADPLGIPAFESLIPPQCGADWAVMLSGESAERRALWLSVKDQAETEFCGTYGLQVNGGTVWIEERLVRLSDDGGGVRFLGRVRDVSASHGQLEKLRYLARFDELTGHLSRSSLRVLLARRMDRARETGETISFGMIGLDNLSGFNSTFGYDVADAVLVRIGEEILNHLGPQDAVGRTGSSKFAVVFADCETEQMAERMAGIQKAVRDTVIETAAGPVVVTVSAAGLCLPQDASTTHDALALAEDTLNHAKDFGLDQVVIYKPDAAAVAQRRDNIALADDLVAAVRENRLRLAYQPVVQAHDPSQVAFHECLLRLIDRSGEVIPAGAFIPIAEKLGLVRMLDRRVLELAFETLRQNARVRLSVNISPQSLRDTRWTALFERLAAENPNALERMILEVTEATVIDDVEATARVLTRFRKMGCAVALDDFGAGYTSFQQLRDLTFDIVKIDGAYVRNVLDRPGDQVFIEALASIAKYHDLLIVAEMVDNDEVADLLRTLGVDTFQGFHFGRPEIAPDWLGNDVADRIVQSVGCR